MAPVVRYGSELLSRQPELALLQLDVADRYAAAASVASSKSTDVITLSAGSRESAFRNARSFTLDSGALLFSSMITVDMLRLGASADERYVTVARYLRRFMTSCPSVGRAPDVDVDERRELAAPVRDGERLPDVGRVDLGDVADCGKRDALQRERFAELLFESCMLASGPPPESLFAPIGHR